MQYVPVAVIRDGDGKNFASRGRFWFSNNQRFLSPLPNGGTAEKNTEDAAAVVADRKRKKRRDELSLAATKRKMGGEIAARTKRKEMENDRPRIFYKRRTTLWDLPYWLVRSFGIILISCTWRKIYVTTLSAHYSTFHPRQKIAQMLGLIVQH